jgi:uncharacterized membrane protein YuzA (DUF378 family)
MILFAGINIGAIGMFGFDILQWLFGPWETRAQVLIGIAAVWQTLRQRW